MGEFDLPSIPDDIFNNRCMFCMFYIKGKENRAIRTNEVYRIVDNPCVCKIQSIALYKYQEHNENWTEVHYEVYKDGECRSFTPNFGYPICRDCGKYNPFCRTDDKEKFGCTTEPVNRRIAVLGNRYGNNRDPYEYMVCDKWVMEKVGRHRAIQRVAEGKLPQCFDPKTYLLLTPTNKNVVAEEWIRITREHEQEKAKREKEAAEKTMIDENGQYKMF